MPFDRLAVPVLRNFVDGEPDPRACPAFGYVIEGEMSFEIEGYLPRVLKSGEVF